MKYFKKSILLFFICSCLILVGFFCFSRSGRIQFSVHEYLKCPYINVKMNHQKYLCKIDTGAKNLILSTEILNKTSKKFIKSTSFIDVEGRLYNANVFIIPSLQLKTLHFHSIQAEEYSESWRINAYFGSQSNLKGESGLLGRDIFNNFIFLLDSYRNKLYLTQSLKDIRRLGYKLKEMTQVPCRFTKFGVIVPITTEW